MERPAVDQRSSLIASREEQRFHFERNLSEQIESTLLTIDGVLEARVHLNLPDTDPLLGLGLNAKGTGSVLLLVGSNAQLKQDDVAALVAGASGVPIKSISVLISITEPPPRPSPEREQLLATLSTDGTQSVATETAWWAHLRTVDWVTEFAWSLVVIGAGGVAFLFRRGGVRVSQSSSYRRLAS